MLRTRPWAWGMFAGNCRVERVVRGQTAVAWNQTSVAATVAKLPEMHENRVRLRLLGCSGDASSSIGNATVGVHQFVLEWTNTTTITVIRTITGAASTIYVSWEVTVYVPGTYRRIYRGSIRLNNSAANGSNSIDGGLSGAEFLVNTREETTDLGWRATDMTGENPSRIWSYLEYSENPTGSYSLMYAKRNNASFSGSVEIWHSWEAAEEM